MTIHELIKKAIEDKDLRSNLFADAMATCEKFGVRVESLIQDPSRFKFKIDRSIMQGGYRP